jgi:WD40 repeat protein
VLLFTPISSGVKTVMGRSLFLPLGLFVCSIASAQQACPPLQPPVPDPAKLLFTPKQETELGEIIRQQFESDFHVIEDTQVTAYLDRVGQRVARHLPDTGIHFEFLLYDLPEIQAFSMPGGRIYVSRKMVAFLKNEDELAGVLGHEMGHVAARQQALELSSSFREILGLKSVSDTDDLFALYNQLTDSLRLKKRRAESSGNEDKGQSIADQIGVQAVARAGYSPQAFPDALDRLMATKGKTGNWVTDIFGATSSSSRRLREALKDVSSLPRACIEAASAASPEEFQRWQSAVLHYNGIGHAERLPGVLSRKSLSNPLRGDIEHFRFSPDGKYLLAQDEGGIYVLTRDPLQFLFRIDSADAQPAQFSPDAKQVVFFSSHLRVETWDIDRQEQVSVTDVSALNGCRQTALSPDAKYLACFDNELNLSLFDVASGEILLKREKFFTFESPFNAFAGFYRILYLLTHTDVVVLRFSPDGHYFAASSHTEDDVVYDLTTRKKISVPGTIHTLMHYSFTFLGPDRIVGLDTSHAEKSPIAEFPSGKVLDRVPLGGGTLVAATNPKYLLIRPIINYPVGGYDLEKKALVYTNRMSATDVWDDVTVSERLNGEIALHKLGEVKASVVTQLPLGKLGALQTVAASPDLKFLAISGRTRGGIWNLDANDRVFHLRAFQSAYYTSNVTFFLDFPSFEKTEREMAVASPVTRQAKSRPVEKDDNITFFGDVLFRVKYSDKNHGNHRNYDLDALDIVDQKPLWSRNFPKSGPTISGSASSGKVVFLWTAHSDGVRDEVARDPKLQALWDKAKPKDGDYLLEALDSRSGSLAGGAVLLTGNRSYNPENVKAVGNWLVVEDNHNRVLLYSLSTGEQVARWFGDRPQISQNGQRLCLSNGRGHLMVYDLQNLKQIDDLYFSNSIVAHLFSGDGTKLFVLAADQTAFQFDVGANAR